MERSKHRRANCAGCGPVPARTVLRIGPDGRLYCERCALADAWRANVAPRQQVLIATPRDRRGPRDPEGASR